MMQTFYLCLKKRPVGFNLHLKTLEDSLRKIFKLQNENKIMKGN